MDQRDDNQEAERTHEKLHEEHRATPDSTARVKFDNDEPKRVPSVSTPKLEVVRPSINKFFILKLASSMVEHHGMSVRTPDVFAYNGDSLVSGRCTQDTPTRNVTFPHK